ncbi:reverse transcriptase domain-containing protein [Tanacetum coccineum]
MGKNLRHQESTNAPLQNGNHAGRMNKVLHALNRRHRWQNVRKVLPNKRQGSGKHIIDGGTSEPTENTSKPGEVHGDPKKDKSKIEQGNKEAHSKTSKKFRIRSMISDEMAKRRGINHWRRQTSQKKKTNSANQIKNDRQKSPTNVTENNCDSPRTTKKKRKCDICAAMLTLSYLRQQGFAHERRMEDNVDEKQQSTTIEISQESDGHDTHYMHSHTPLNSRIGLTKSFSIPIIGSSKRRDFELEDIKDKLKDCKDLQTAKEKFILPMKLWSDIRFSKPMLTRPASFRASSSISQKENKQIQSKSLKQKIGFVIKDGKKEKRRILMDSVLHKIPYGRRTSKDPKKLSPEKLKSNSTSSSGSHRSSLEKLHLKKTSSTGLAMSKYQKLLSQTSTRDDKLHHSDHKPRLCVAEDHSFGSIERKSHKRIRSLPNISPSDFMINQEFPVKPTMNIHQSITSDIFDEDMSSDHSLFAERRNTGKEFNKDVGVKHELGASIESAKKDTEFVNDDIGDHQENNDQQKESSAANNSELVANEDNIDPKKNIDRQNESNAVQDNAIHQEDIENQNESRVTIQMENDKSFNEVLGMFKKVSDERTKLNPENESSSLVRKVSKNTTVDKDQGVHKNKEVSQKTLDHHKSDKSPLTSDLEVEWLIDKALLEELSYENRLYMFSKNDQLPVDKKDMSAADNYMVVNTFLHLDINTVKDNAEFQFVKEVLERSGFLENELLGEWYSSYQPIDPLLFEEVEASFLQTKYLEELDSMKVEEDTQRIINDHHLLLFDLVNEAKLQ